MCTCSAWLSSHSPQYSSRRSARIGPSSIAMPQASSIARTELVW
jgi:hypothetical protein